MQELLEKIRQLNTELYGIASKDSKETGVIFCRGCSFFRPIQVYRGISKISLLWGIAPRLSYEAIDGVVNKCRAEVTDLASGVTFFQLGECRL